MMYNVLIVDDERIIRIGLRSLINWEEVGFKIIDAVSDGKQALAVIEREKVDLILTDIKMPYMDGITLVQNLYERGFLGEIIMLTSYGEFEFARQCLRYGVGDYLLKGTLVPDELMQAVLKVQRKLDEKGEKLFEEEREDINNEQDLKIIEHIFKTNHLEGENNIEKESLSMPYVFLLFKHVQSKAQKEKHRACTLEAYRESIENIISEAVPNQSIPRLFFEGEWGLYLFPNGYVEQKDVLHRISMHILNLIKLYTNIKIIGVISKVIYTSYDLRESLKKTQDVAELSFYKGYEEVLEEEMHILMKPYLSRSTQVVEERLHQAMNKGDYSEANNLLDMYMEEMRRVYVPKEQVEERLNPLLQGIILDYSIYLESDKSRLNELVESYRASTLLDEMQGLIKELIYMICTLILQIKNKNYRREIVEIMDYIEQHITEKITLNSIANQINMNESYISRLFKSETGMNIIQYINVSKMEKAKELLKEKNMIVKDVAYALGFEEQSYFNRMFNKYFGVNPKEYKKYTNLSQ